MRDWNYKKDKDFVGLDVNNSQKSRESKQPTKVQNWINHWMVILNNNLFNTKQPSIINQLGNLIYGSSVLNII